MSITASGISFSEIIATYNNKKHYISSPIGKLRDDIVPNAVDDNVYLFANTSGSIRATQYSNSIYAISDSSDLIQVACGYKHSWSNDTFYITKSSGTGELNQNTMSYVHPSYIKEGTLNLPISTEDPSGKQPDPEPEPEPESITIPVQWRAPSGVLLESSFNITVK